jgi:hypothetical protein
MKAILKVRLIQVKRELASLGIFRLLFVVSGFIFLAFGFFVKMQDESVRSWIVLAYFSGIVSIQLRRKDFDFLSIYFEKPVLIRFAEYLILSTPLLIILIFNHLWIHIFVLFGGLTILPHITLSQTALPPNTLFRRWIPDTNYEWKGGLRRTLWVFVLIWSLALTTSFFIGSVPVGILILGIIVMGFYEKTEPLIFLLLPELNASQFLLTKIFRHSSLFLFINLPLFIAFLVFHSGLYYIPLFELLIFTILIPYFILVKYTFYHEGSENKGIVQIFASIGILSVFVPFLLPLIVGLSIYFSLKAHQNLKFYLDDFNS